MTVPFTVVTLTGDRPVSFALCKAYLERQTLKPAQWVVVDDGEVPLDPSSILISGIDVCYVRRIKAPTDPRHTLTCNLQASLLSIATTRLVFMEDDDWYAPTYLQALNEAFDKGADIVGQASTVYYRLARREWRDNFNSRHASLCATGVSSVLYPLVDLACRNGSPLVDLFLWKRASMFTNNRLLLSGTPRLHVGMKEVPGRQGQTSGWGQESRKYTIDPDGSALVHLVGKEDAEVYERMITNG